MCALEHKFLPAGSPLLACVLRVLLQYVLHCLLACLLAAFVAHSLMYDRLSYAAILDRPNFKVIPWFHLVVHCCISWGNQSLSLIFTFNTIIWYVKWIGKSQITTLNDIKAVVLSDHILLEHWRAWSISLVIFLRWFFDSHQLVW